MSNPPKADNFAKQNLLNRVKNKNMTKEYSFEELYKELKKQAKEKGIQSDYEYLDLIDKIIIEKKNAGLLSEDEDIDQVKDDLEAMWPEIESGIEKKAEEIDMP